MNPDERERLTKLKDTFARGVLVHTQMPDDEARFRLGLHAGWALPVVREPGEYGRHPPWLKAVASPEEVTEMETVMVWLAWLRRRPDEGVPAVRRIIGWATGIPMSVLGWRERVSARTIDNRIDRSVGKVLREFFAVPVAVETVEEAPERRRDPNSAEIPAKGAPERAASFASSPDSLLPGKVFIAGIGMMQHGKPYDPLGDAVRRAAARQRRRRA